MPTTLSIDRERDRSDRVATVSIGRSTKDDLEREKRPSLSDQERERKSLSSATRAEKMERKRLSEAIVAQTQNIPLDRNSDDIGIVGEVKRHRSVESSTPPGRPDKSGRMNGSEPRSGASRDFHHRSRSREGDGGSSSSMRSRDLEPDRTTRGKKASADDLMVPATSSRSVSREHFRSKDVVADVTTTKEMAWMARDEDSSPRERVRAVKDDLVSGVRERHRARDEELLLKEVDDKEKRSSEKRLKKSKRR